jgi:citronellol/citronellal dehydrogenase
MSHEQADAKSQPPQEMFGLADDELAIRRTVFASDALEDMVVVVTGATGGIGRAIAWLFARAAIKPVLTP